MVHCGYISLHLSFGFQQVNEILVQTCRASTINPAYSLEFIYQNDLLPSEVYGQPDKNIVFVNSVAFN